MKTLKLPFTKGGRKIPDLKTRNKGIEIIKTQQYLKLDSKHPKWALVADMLISERIMRKPEETKPLTMNVFF